MELITGDRKQQSSFFDRLQFSDDDDDDNDGVGPTRTDVDFASTESAAEMMLMIMNPPPLPLPPPSSLPMPVPVLPLPPKKLLPIRKSPDPPAAFAIKQFSSSSDDDDEDEYSDENGGGGCYDSSMCEKESTNRKRKRESCNKMEYFMKNLATKVMKKQEEMHQQLIELIELRERERIVKEDEWKRQEMERMIKDEEMRAYEISRVGGSKAIVSREFTPDQMNKRWPDAEIHALIQLRVSLETKFRNMGYKSNVWDEVSVSMQNIGYNRSAKKCKEKWENMNKYFRKSIESGKKPHENGKTCLYFNELNELYQSGIFKSGIH
ncbi:hypothetical protein ACFE04_030911 [Oxalis oulophora]